VDQFTEFVVNHWVLWSAFAAVLALLVVDLARGGGSQSLSPQQVVRMINSDHAVVLDVRPAAEYDRGHIIEAVNIPLESLAARNKDLEKLKGKPVIVCCAAGNASARAGKTLATAGVEKIYILKGGVAAWRQENLPLRS
jgi:rhodanese-related sulfurtransferase